MTPKRSNRRLLALLALTISLQAQEVPRSWSPDPQGGPPPPRGWRGGPRIPLDGYDPATANFTAPWPATAGLKGNAITKVIEETPATVSFIYESLHFRIQSDVAIRPADLTRIATILESCFQAHHDIPLNNRRTRSPGAPKLKVRLFETLERYRLSGAPPGTVGAYLGRSDELAVPLESIGLKKSGSSYTFDPNSDFHVLFHEITHLLWADLGQCAGTWMSEGFAEYMGCLAYRDGRFSFAQLPSSVLTFATAHGEKGSNGGRALGKEFVMPDLSDLMTLSQEAFYKNPNNNYGYGLLLVHYFLLADGKGDAAKFKACIKALQSGQSADEARKILL
ncbi:MAG: hypothetical protein CFE26_17765, partial [Verrucomicrobiales bacterium VVV1]